MISVFDSVKMEQLRSQMAIQPHDMKLFYNAVFKKALSPQEAVLQLPEQVRTAFGKAVQFSHFSVDFRQDSEKDGASKLRFKTDDGHLIESVILRPTTGRTSLCISSQVGCVCRCSFCATGTMGILRDLTHAEIVDQVIQSARLLREEGRAIRNVVFMGMGEPLYNPENLFRALEYLLEPRFINLSPSHVMVSTVGIVEGMLALQKRFPQVSQALSLHSARQEVRELLIPVARKYPLSALKKAIEVIGQQKTVMIEYLLLAGINDGQEDLDALMDYLAGLPVHINLIPFNTHAGSSFKGSSQSHRAWFADELKARGFKVTLRYSLGGDIDAACGQLVKKSKDH